VPETGVNFADVAVSGFIVLLFVFGGRGGGIFF
jgi:hypothetical protein